MPLHADEPESVVQRQLGAYNAYDIDAFMATYANDAELFAHPDTLLAKGSDQIRARYTARFSNDRPHAVIVSRIVRDAIVIDEEEITVPSKDGVMVTRAVAIYEVRQGRIRIAWFII
jgi:putative hydrolase of HD superfamily